VTGNGGLYKISCSCVFSCNPANLALVGLANSGYPTRLNLASQRICLHQVGGFPHFVAQP